MDFHSYYYFILVIPSVKTVKMEQFEQDLQNNTPSDEALGKSSD